MAKDPRSKKERKLQGIVDKLAPVLEEERESTKRSSELEKQKLDAFNQMAGLNCIIEKCPGKLRIIGKKEIWIKNDGIVVERDDDNLVLECSEGHQIVPPEDNRINFELDKKVAAKLEIEAKKRGVPLDEFVSLIFSDFVRKFKEF
ncbi:MAG TPA: hypothetical protein VN739_10315 [Nitrososphaerales archaeon]|nr:hypothetical protein [Nitrososphaerales archaeon]